MSNVNSSSKIPNLATMLPSIKKPLINYSIALEINNNHTDEKL